MSNIDTMLEELIESRFPSQNKIKEIKSNIMKSDILNLDTYEMIANIFEKAFSVCNYFRTFNFS